MNSKTKQYWWNMNQQYLYLPMFYWLIVKFGRPCIMYFSNLWFGLQRQSHNSFIYVAKSVTNLPNIPVLFCEKKESWLCTPYRRAQSFKFCSGFPCPFPPWPFSYTPGQPVHCQVVKRWVGISASDHRVTAVAKSLLQDQTEHPSDLFTPWFHLYFLQSFFPLFILKHCYWGDVSKSWSDQ